MILALPIESRNPVFIDVIYEQYIGARVAKKKIKKYYPFGRSMGISQVVVHTDM